MERLRRWLLSRNGGMGVQNENTAPDGLEIRPLTDPSSGATEVTPLSCWGFLMCITDLVGRENHVLCLCPVLPEI
jgi:hypothetical protein